MLEKGEKREDLRRRPTGKAEKESDFVSFGVSVFGGGGGSSQCRCKVNTTSENLILQNWVHQKKCGAPGKEEKEKGKE